MDQLIELHNRISCGKISQFFFTEFINSMNKVLVLIGNCTINTEMYFTNFIPTFDDICDQRVLYFKNHASYKNFYVYMAKSLEQTSYEYKVFNELKYDNEIKQVGEIGQYIIHLSVPILDRGKLVINRNLVNLAKNNIILLFNDATAEYIEKYKKEYNTKKAFHEDNFHDLVKKLFPEAIRQIEFVDVEMALLIGGQGAGKTRLYQKITHQIISDQKEFDQYIFKNDQFQLVDSPSLDLTSDVNKRESIIKEYAKFFIVHQQVISTFFFILNHERFDKMKNMLLSLYTPLKKFLNKITIIVSNWKDSQEEQAQKQQIQELALKLKINNVLYINEQIEAEELKQLLKNHLTGQKGISIQDTMFQLEKNEIDQQYDEKLHSQVKKIEENDKKEKFQYKENLILQNTRLNQEIQEFEQKIFEFQERIKNNRNQIFNNENQIRQIDWDYNRDSYYGYNYNNSDSCYTNSYNNSQNGYTNKNSNYQGYSRIYSRNN